VTDMSSVMGVAVDDTGGGSGLRLDRHLGATALATTIVQIASLTAATFTRAYVMWWVVGLFALAIQVVAFLRLVVLAWRWARRRRQPGGGPPGGPPGGPSGGRPPRYSGIVVILVAMAISTVCHFALAYVAAVSSLGTFTALYCALGTLATVRASLEGYASQDGWWRMIAMIQEGWDMVFISGIVAIGIAMIAQLLNDE
jgi:hypothetical protein